jgi:RNA polymerase sigma-70 factor, ECF subfamily
MTSDRDLVDGVVRDGNERAFRELYRRHTPRLYLTALRLLGQSPMDAEDAVQETWIRAVREMGRFRWESSLGTWLIAIVGNVARDQLRSARRREARDLATVVELEVEHHQGVGIDLERAIALLPEGYRAVLVLHDVEGLTHEEIGAALGIAPGTSKSQLFGARRSMRALLNPMRNEG